MATCIVKNFSQSSHGGSCRCVDDYTYQCPDGSLWMDQGYGVVTPVSAPDRVRAAPASQTITASAAPAWLPWALGAAAVGAALLLLRRS